VRNRDGWARHTAFSTPNRPLLSDGVSSSANGKERTMFCPHCGGVGPGRPSILLLVWGGIARGPCLGHAAGPVYRRAEHGERSRDPHLGLRGMRSAGGIGDRGSWCASWSASPCRSSWIAALVYWARSRRAPVLAGMATASPPSEQSPGLAVNLAPHHPDGLTLRNSNRRRRRNVRLRHGICPTGRSRTVGGNFQQRHHAPSAAGRPAAARGGDARGHG